MRRSRPCAIFATPKSRLSAARPAPAPAAIIFRACSKSCSAPSSPSSPVTPAVMRSTSPRSATKWSAGHLPPQAYFSREPYHTWRKTNLVRILMQTGEKKDPQLPDTPLLSDLMNEYKTPELSRRVAVVMLGSGELGRPMVTHPATPPDRIKLLRDGFMKAMADPALLEEAKQKKLDITPVSGEQLDQDRQGGHRPAGGSGRADQKDIGAVKILKTNSNSTPLPLAVRFETLDDHARYYFGWFDPGPVSFDYCDLHGGSESMGQRDECGNKSTVHSGGAVDRRRVGWQAGT